MVEFGTDPVYVFCDRCQQNVRTRTDSEAGTTAWVLFGAMCLLGLWPCSLIPCCIDSLQNVSHSCPKCSMHLGFYKA